MPCYDSRDDDDRQRNYQLAAVLCGIITNNGLGILDNLNWKEIGVDKMIVLRWWQAHQEKDRQRRLRELEFKKKTQQKTNELKLLSQDELIELLVKKRK